MDYCKNLDPKTFNNSSSKGRHFGTLYRKGLPPTFHSDDVTKRWDFVSKKAYPTHFILMTSQSDGSLYEKDPPPAICVWK